MSQPSWIGYTLGGRYKIEALVGQGGMSAVFRATDPNLRRAVAIKLIHAHLSGDPEFVRRFEAEAAAVAQLRHPNIVQVYDFNHDGDTYYMVLEFVPGETLQARLRRLNDAKQRMPPDELMRVALGVCEAVDYAHQRGLIHRDIKPGNIMINPQGQPVLMDFGVAKILGEAQHTATGAVVGTASYISPEQVRGQRPDARSDLYSLGVTLFEMIAGRPPFESDSAMSLMLKHVNEPLPDIRPFLTPPGSTPEGLVAIIEKALAKEPADRYQTAAEMVSALRSLVGSQQTVPVTLPTEAVGAKPAEGVPPVADASSPPFGRPQARPSATLTPGLRPPLSGEGALGGTGPSATLRTGPLEETIPARTRRVPVPLLAGLAGLICVIALWAAARSGGLFTFSSRATATEVVVVATSVASATLAPATATTPPLAATGAPTASEAPASPTPLSERAATPTQGAPTPEPTATAIAIPEGMVPVPAGAFVMGTDLGNLDEAPAHTVTLDAFFMDQFEVTNARYKLCVDAGGCTLPSSRGSFTHLSYFDNPDFQNFPVVWVSWDKADAFCRWDGGKRLPTEAEWEYAATGGDGRRFPWGSDFDPARLPVREPDTTAVGSYPDGASPFGVYDMAGNVLEWVGDFYGRAYYASAQGVNPAGPPTGDEHVLRGGSFGNPDGSLYTTTRRFHLPPNRRDVDIGFRCALSLPLD